MTGLKNHQSFGKISLRETTGDKEKVKQTAESEKGVTMFCRAFKRKQDTNGKKKFWCIQEGRKQFKKKEPRNIDRGGSMKRSRECRRK